MTHKLLGNFKKGKLFIVSAPAGTGKTTLVKMLLEEFPCVVTSTSYTTREPRPRELNGRDYHFVSTRAFEERIASSDFLEYVKLYGCYYGTSKSQVYEKLAQGKHVILVIDTQGAAQIRGKIEASFIFIEPPSLKALKKRLEQRRTESTEAIEERLFWAKQEMNAKSSYDYCIVNEDLELAYQVLRSILIAEEHHQSKGATKWSLKSR